ncbi:MAG: D-glycero-beta-D-manno-heptose 1,7-bisphosphate 7-phosphatase [Planctomycetota bacterium]|nr:D-glycero-beta-D-manno-heptose 1,7-bisphosphate 7-phosphatase [Planctomycetota bacterium]MEC8510616.1 D-glycero-beta-D-manno-heptose 1,7-bisphosphate 7-phosphatase [Planctomycetota bacterium]MEE2940069.1 D-glycero-beta-D-manno-heptose 1,7-bisphosphate 7-phosphatase [Planctomycetota bacterium]
MTGRPAVFLDRDGTLNVEVDYLADPARFELLPGAAEGLARLAAAGFALVVVTNQSGVARGLLDEDVLARIHDRMAADLAAHGVTLDLVLYCPHHPTEGSGAHRADCSCRKPRPGMLLEAAGRLELDLHASWCIGDSLRDLEAAAAVGARGVLVRTGKGASQEAALARLTWTGTTVVDDIGDAASLILEAR